MFVNPEALIDQTIDNLQLVSEPLGDDLDALTNPGDSPEAMKSRDTVRAIGFLVPKLRSAKVKLRQGRAVSELQGLPPQRICANCDDF